MKTVNALLAVAGLALAATQLSCSVNDYCLNCGVDDGGMGSGDGDANDGGGSGTDATIDAACVPTGLETCDGKDNDCNGLADDGVLPEVGDPCANQLGACQGGVKVCDPITDTIKCDKSPKPEACNNIDDNCNDDIDEGDPGGGGLCGTQAGACVAGTFRCINGSVRCDGFQNHTNDPEECNGQDDDCDDLIDDNVPSAGACGQLDQDGIGFDTDGICKPGAFVCMGGVNKCVGAVFPEFETCDQEDDDCDGVVDQIFDTQNDPKNCGACAGFPGGAVCATPSKTCINATNAGAKCTAPGDCTAGTGLGTPDCVVNSQPKCTAGVCGLRCNAGFFALDNDVTNGCEYKCSKTGPEECDGVDNDCDGFTDRTATNQPLTPPLNLCEDGGECAVGLTGNVCTNATNAGATCTNATTCIAGAGLGTPACVPRTRPDAVCDGTGGWTCEGQYQGQTEFPEVSCDGLNNDCDSNTDEAHFPDAANHVKGGACNDGEPGECLDSGTYICNTAAPTGNLVCDLTTNNKDLPFGTGNPAPGENCNAKDDDCDNKVDEALATGQDWVSIGNNVQMMAFEASRPDADETNAGSIESIVCSAPDKAPWTNVTYPVAAAACAGVGARLCTEQEWHRTCSVVASPTFPLGVIATGTLIEAENYSSLNGEFGPTACGIVGTLNTADNDNDAVVNDGCPAVGLPETGTNCTNSTDNDADGFVNDGCPVVTAATAAWVPDYTVAPGNVTAAGTFSSISALEATPNTGANITAANAKAQSPRLDYNVNITESGTYHIWVRMFSNNANDNTVYVGLSSTATPVAVTSVSNNSWVWVDAASTFSVTAGAVPLATTLSVWMGKDGTKIDQVRITTSAVAPTDPSRATLDASRGGTWAFTSPADPFTFSDTCNGDDHDTNLLINGDQDDILKTKSLPNCRANVGTGIYDMSGNVKEWTVAHLPGENPIRGGASNNSSVGISCALNFTLANDTLLLPNIGFRCCK